ncbi:VWA domain-containing protein [Cerasicoccus arenae]|uniref:Aerotolerance protein BatA n=1 Tax=Cerasicoccus arenae TaxID=424488 RepID=A0A8J3DB97_9BACT|nr:VWA domain-containing protein [Cerasicoccus arenae]MBK1858583.1 VWA domain-containing protein [Cerasicoccus arenae]GHC05164.1 aerotolerance protein BatA [Cerasicoccus arenae]
MTESFEFRDQWVLWFLLALPLLLFIKGRTGRSASLLFSSTAIARDVAKQAKSRAGGFLFFLRLLALAALIVALARPQIGKGHSEVEASGIDIVLAVDVSGSMAALDFATQRDVATRLDIVKRVITDFVEKRPNDRIGLVAFAKEPFLVSPLTLNHDWLRKNLDRLELGIIDGGGTAIGPAIGMSANRLRDLPAKSRVVVLLTDGEDTVGQLPPIAAAEAAETFDVKIYTIAAGKTGRVPMPATDRNGQLLRDRDGNLVLSGYQNSYVDEETLTKIADITGGKFYRATNQEQLAAIYDDIDELEKTEVKLRHFAEYEELFFWPALIGLGLISLEQLLGNTRFKRLP